MTRIEWDVPGERMYETGVARGVLYPPSGIGVPWTGLISVTESPTEGEPKPLYIDGIKYMNRPMPEEFEGTIEAFTYPDEFALCDGTQALAAGFFVTNQDRKPFGLCYRTRIGTDQTPDFGYKLHLLYNVMAAPTESPHKTIHDTPEPLVFSWSITATPELVANHRASAHLVIDSTKVDPTILASIEDLLYGSNSNVPTLPSPADLIALFGASPGPSVSIVINGDGTFTITAPDSILTFPDANTFTLDSSTVTNNGDGTYTITTP